MLCVPARVSLITALPRPAEQMSLPAALGAPEWLPASRNQTPTPPPAPPPTPTTISPLLCRLLAASLASAST